MRFLFHHSTANNHLLKYIALSLFIIFPVIAFFVGVQYGILMNSTQPATAFPAPTPTPLSSIEQKDNGWRIYTNKDYGFTIEYPGNLYLKESDNFAGFAYVPFPTESIPGPSDLIQIRGANEFSGYFNSLYAASPLEEVPQAANAVDVKVTKLSNKKLGNYDAVEYIRDGIYHQTSGLGRGYIGYEHNIFVKLDNNSYIIFTNTTDTKEETEKRDIEFNKMLDSIIFN